MFADVLLNIKGIVFSFTVVTSSVDFEKGAVLEAGDDLPHDVEKKTGAGAI